MASRRVSLLVPSACTAGGPRCMAARPDSSAPASRACTAASALACCPNTSGASLSGMAAMWACSELLKVKGAAFVPGETVASGSSSVQAGVRATLFLRQEHAGTCYWTAFCAPLQRPLWPHRACCSQVQAQARRPVWQRPCRTGGPGRRPVRAGRACQSCARHTSHHPQGSAAPPRAPPTLPRAPAPTGLQPAERAL